MFSRNKQKGFISAELGIGILVISLLTIMGFLAATDLDDEITRSSNNGVDVVGEFSHIGRIFKQIADEGRYEEYQEKRLEIFRQDEESDNGFNGLKSFYESMGIDLSNTYHYYIGSASYLFYYPLKDVKFEFTHYIDHMKARITIRRNCSNWLPIISEAYPNVFDKNCSDVGDSGELESTQVLINANSKETFDKGDFLEGTWMGDL